MRFLSRAIAVIGVAAVAVTTMSGGVYAAQSNYISGTCANGWATGSLRHVTTPHDEIQLTITSSVPSNLEWEIEDADPNSQYYKQIIAGPFAIKTKGHEYTLMTDVLSGTEFKNRYACGGTGTNYYGYEWY